MIWNTRINPHENDALVRSKLALAWLCSEKFIVVYSKKDQQIS